VRLSGPNARALAARLAPAASPLRPRLATYATIHDEDGHAIDRGLVLLFARPHSYTGEDVVEFQLHGSPVVARELMRALIACGARPAAAGEFSRRALLNGKMDAHAAAAVADLIAAETRSAARAAAANLAGGLAPEIEALRARLATALEDLAAAVDFPDEVPDPDRARLAVTLDEIVERLQALLREGEAGRIVREGVSVAIVGPPNAGKSSLLNALLGHERAIVSEMAGTTRDTIEERLSIDGVAVRLVDTAGIRAHAGHLEAAGIERTRHALETARIALVVVDGSRPPSPEAVALLHQTRGRERVVFFNKADLGDGARAEAPEGAVWGSARDPATLEPLRREIARTGWGGTLPDLERPHLASVRELGAVADAVDALGRARATVGSGEPVDFAVGELQRAFKALGHVSERIAAEEVLDGIFSRFCIGK